MGTPDFKYFFNYLFYALQRLFMFKQVIIPADGLEKFQVNLEELLDEYDDGKDHLDIRRV